ncbi:hypothetical protein BCA37_10650 [Mycobacterium sp. djl-10]|nr:hypothetical protein BCA37_10650 [Mycobacterium sp. djl-10]
MLTGHIGLNAAKPTPGAVAVCVYCRALAIFTVFGTLRRPTEAEEAELLGDPSVTRAIQVVAEYHQKSGAPHG